MKKSLLLFFLFLLYFILLFYSDTVLSGTKKGLILWFDTIIPSLFPFIVLCKLIPVFLPSCCLLGLLSGYPLGAMLTKESYLLNDNKNPHNFSVLNKYQTLLGFVNIASPVFICGYVCTSCFAWKNERYLFTLSIYLGTFFSYILCLIFFTNHQKNSNCHSYSVSQKQSSSKNFSINSLLLDSASSLIVFGGFIILSAILIEFIQKITFLSPFYKAVFSCMIEFTNGLHLLSHLYQCGNISKLAASSITVFFLSFGCFSIFLQTASILHSTKLSIKKYIVQKFLAGLLSVITFFILESIFF